MYYNWDEYLSYLKNANLIISNDSLAAHISAVFDVKSITLRTGISKDSHWKPISNVNKILRHPTQCPPCYKKRLREHELLK